MAGQGLTAEQIAAAGQQAASNQQQAAPAQSQQQQQAPPAANQQQQQPGNNQQQSGEFIISQAQFDQRWAEKMGGLERELGLQPGGLKDFVAAQKVAQNPKPPTGEALSGADLKLAKMEALMTVGVPSQQIPIILQHFNIAGKTREDIQGSIQQLIDAKLLTIAPPAPAPGTQPQQPPGPPTAAQGAGNNGVPGLSAIATMTKADLAAKCKDPVWYDANRDAVLKRLSELR